MSTSILPIDKKLRRFIRFPVRVSDGRKLLKMRAFLDSGASSIFINRTVVERFGLRTRPLVPRTRLYNADNTLNNVGWLTDEVPISLTVGDHTESVTAVVADIGDYPLIIGVDWLRLHNPEIDWANDKMTFTRCADVCKPRPDRTKVELERPPDADAVRAVRSDERTKPRRTKAKPAPRVRVTVAELDDDSDDSGTPEEPADERDKVPPGFRHSEKYWDIYHDSEQFFVSDDPDFVQRIAASYTWSQAIAEKTAVKEGEKSFEELVPEQYRDFAKVFSKDRAERLPTRKPYDHAIDLVPGAVPSYSKIYPMAPNERTALKEFIEENLRKGYIRPSKSPAAAPVFFIKKKDGSLRMVVDYRKLNAMTVKNRYPLPLTTELIDSLKKAKVFTTLDLRAGYHNVRMKEGDEWKAAFRTQEGHFEPTVMTFGLTNAPATFQHMMNEIFKDLAGVIVIIYLDDILIFSENEEEHVEHVRTVLERLEKHDLFVKPEKCKFHQSSVDYLGMVIGAGTVSMDPAKVSAVLEWPVPSKVKDIQAFLGFANFYRRFIEDYSRIVRPMTELLRKDVRFEWGPRQQASFEELKRRFTEAPVLAMPDLEKPFILECDASDFATGAVLSQVGTDGSVHPVAFYSKSLNDAERNYEIYDKELLAIVRSLDEWRHYLEGSPHTIDVISDHKNLLYFSEARNLTRRQARWSIFLSRFDFTIRHRPGRLGGKPDAMSRRVDLQPDGTDNANRTLLDRELFRMHAMRRGMARIEGDTTLLRRIRGSRSWDEELVEAIEALKGKAPVSLKKELQDWNTEDGLLLYRGKVYVPKDEAIRRDIVKLHHDSLPVGHPGRWKTYELVSRNYWWPGMSPFVERYVSGCDTCMRTKNLPHRPVGPLEPNEVPDGPWQTITCDFITQLPPSNGFDAIFVVADRLTKQAHFVPTTSDIDSTRTAELFVSEVWKHHGTPRKVISDRGPQFVSRFMKEIFKRLGIKGSTSTSFHPQTDGQTERVNQELEQYLRAFTDVRQENWASLLPMAEFAHNTRAHSATRLSPFALLYGYEPGFAIVPSTGLSTVPAADDRLDMLKKAQDDAQAALEVAADRMKRYYDQHRTDVPDLEPGDRVWLEARNIALPGARKLNHRRLGPYEIVRKLSPLNYELKLPASMKVHPVFHVSLLTKYQPDTIPGRVQPPPEPVPVDGDIEYEVQEVINSRRTARNQKLQYLVRWKGYQSDEDTWVDEADMAHARAKIRAFHRKYPTAVR